MIQAAKEAGHKLLQASLDESVLFDNLGGQKLPREKSVAIVDSEEDAQTISAVYLYGVPIAVAS